MNPILATAAAIGNEFDTDLCRIVADISADEAHRLLDEVSRASIVAALDHGRYRFTHALIREAVYDELDTAARVRVHGKIAERMEEIYRENIDPHLAELAHHFREANVTEKAIEYSIRAGQAAVPVAAHAEAVMHWEAALELMEAHGAEAQRRAELLRWLGDVAFSFDPAKSVRHRESAIALYESIGCFEQAALIRIPLGRTFAISNGPISNSGLAIEHFRRAESVLAKGPETIQLAWLYEGIAAYEQQRLHLMECVSATRSAMEISERLGSKDVWSAAAGFQGFVLAVGGQLKQAFALFDRSFEAVDEHNTPGSGQAVADLAGWCCQSLGDPRAGRAWFERELNRPRNARNPWARKELSANSGFTYSEEGQTGELLRRWGSKHPMARFLVSGEWETIAALAETGAAASERANDRVLRLTQGIYLAGFYITLGDYARAEVHLNYTFDGGDSGPLLLFEMRARPLLAITYAAMNRIDGASEQVARCRQIMAAGEDWRGRAGDVARAEGVIEAACGNHDVACRQFQSALAIYQQYHLAFEEADTLRFWGRALAAAGDRTRALEKFDAAVEIYRSRGASNRFAENVTADRTRALGPSTTQNDLRGDRHGEPTASKSTAAFRREGDFWTITYRGVTFQLKNAKGLHYIAYLLARPGQRIHIHDLIQAVEGGAANGRAIHTETENLEIVREIGGSLPIIDARARAEYHTRCAIFRPN